MERLEHLKNLLREAGYEFEVSGYYENAVVTVTVELDEEELPEELKPFAYDDIERHIYKGNSGKRTYNGARFEVALTNYAHHLLHNDPESKELSQTLPLVKSMEELAEYDRKRKAIWARIWEDPKLIEWKRQLEDKL